MQDPIQKTTKAEKTGSMVHVVEQLLCTYKSLSFGGTSTARKQPKYYSEILLFHILYDGFHLKNGNKRILPRAWKN
jgi:hypothetical protein